MWSPTLLLIYSTYLGFTYWKFNFQIILLSNLLGHEIFKRNSMKARMFILVLFYSISWLVFGMESWDLFRHWGKTWLFLDYFSKRYFVVGMLGIQPRAVGVRQVLHSTAGPPRTGPCSMRKFWTHREKSWPVLDFHTREMVSELQGDWEWGTFGAGPKNFSFLFLMPSLSSPSLLSSFPFWDKISD